MLNEQHNVQRKCSIKQICRLYVCRSILSQLFPIKLMLNHNDIKPLNLQIGAKSWRPEPPLPLLKTMISVAFCREQYFGIVVRLPVHGLPPSVTPNDVIASLHSPSDSISSPSGQASAPKSSF